MDVLGAGAGLFLLAPVFAIVSLLIWREMGAPVLFRQTRPGRFGQPFEMVKFRSAEFKAKMAQCISGGIESPIQFTLQVVI